MTHPLRALQALRDTLRGYADALRTLRREGSQAGIEPVDLERWADEIDTILAPLLHDRKLQTALEALPDPPERTTKEDLSRVDEGQSNTPTSGSTAPEN